MSNQKTQLLAGQTLKEMGEHACTLSALGLGRFHRWEFGRTGGLVFATDCYCVFFNADGVAFTGVFSVFADREYKRKFMEIATELRKRRFALDELFEMMDSLQMVNGTSKLNIFRLEEYEQQFKAHIEQTGDNL